MAGKSFLPYTPGQERDIPRVLVCDDSPTTCATVKTVLENHGCFVALAYSGEEALQEIQKKCYDLLLLDIEMDGMSGLEVTATLREKQLETVFLPIILLTGNTDNESRLKGLEAGASDFLTKPFDPAELVARIRNFIGAKRIHDGLVTINKRLEEERDKVRQIQQGLLPELLPELPGHQFASLYYPCEKAGGDIYDAAMRPDGKLLLAVGDVSGHGIPAAMHMSIVRAVCHSAAARGLGVGEILAEMNRILIYGMDDSSFVTFFLSEYDPQTKRLRYASAGHPAPLIHDRAHDIITPLELTAAIPLGIEPEFSVEIYDIILEEYHRLLIYTDGITEETNKDGLPFGEEGFQFVLEQASGMPPSSAVRLVLSSLHNFSGAESLRDDVTMLVMDVNH